MGFFMIFWEKYVRYMEEIIRKTGGEAILTLFASIFSRTTADFVLYVPIFFLNEKQIEMDSMDKWNNIKGYGYQINLYDIFVRKIKHLKQIIITNSAKQKFGGHM